MVGWLVVLRINIDLVIIQPYLDLEAGDNQSLKIQVARPRTFYMKLNAIFQPLRNSDIHEIKLFQGISNAIIPNSDNTYTVISNLSWVPVVADDRKYLVCVLTHSQTLSQTRTANIFLNVQGRLM